jgi:hypothetical protein
VPVAIILAAAVILGGVVVVAMGRGGELARERPDAPASADFRTWSDVAHYRPPAALLGYHARSTEHALSLIARTIAERDAEIDWLRQRLAEARPGLAPYEADEAGSAGSAGLAAGADAGTDDAVGERAGLGHDTMQAEHSFGGRIGEDE